MEKIDLGAMPASELTQEQKIAAKKTIIIKIESEGKVYQEEYDATKGFLLLLDREANDQGPVVEVRRMASPLMLAVSAYTLRQELSEMPAGEQLAMMSYVVEKARGMKK